MDLMGSNSLCFQEGYPFTYSPVRKDGKVHFTYLFIIDNKSEKDEYRILLGKAHFLVNDDRSSVECSSGSGSSSKDPILKPAGKIRLECSIDLEATGGHKLENKDSDGFLVVPSESGGNSENLEFRYKLLIEDFTK